MKDTVFAKCGVITADAQRTHQCEGREADYSWVERGIHSRVSERVWF